MATETRASLDDIFAPKVLTVEERDMLEMVDKLIAKREEESAQLRIDALCEAITGVGIDVDGDGVPDA